MPLDDGGNRPRRPCPLSSTTKWLRNALVVWGDGQEESRESGVGVEDLQAAGRPAAVDHSIVGAEVPWQVAGGRRVHR